MSYGRPFVHCSCRSVAFDGQIRDGVGVDESAFQIICNLESALYVNFAFQGDSPSCRWVTFDGPIRDGVGVDVSLCPRFRQTATWKPRFMKNLYIWATNPLLFLQVGRL